MIILLVFHVAIQKVKEKSDIFLLSMYLFTYTGNSVEAWYKKKIETRELKFSKICSVNKVW